MLGLQLFPKQHSWQQAIGLLTVISVFFNTLLLNVLLKAIEPDALLSSQDILILAYTLLVFSGAILIWKQREAACYILLLHWVWLILQGIFEIYHFTIGVNEALHPLFNAHYQFFQYQIISTAIFKIVFGIPILFYIGKKIIDDLAISKSKDESQTFEDYI